MRATMKVLKAWSVAQSRGWLAGWVGSVIWVRVEGGEGRAEIVDKRRGERTWESG